MSDSRTALVLGATGSFGGAMARQLAARGWRVRALVRDTPRPGRTVPPGVEPVPGDARDAASVTLAAQGVRVIVQGVNYPYHLWDPAMRQAMDASLAAARAAGATLVFPGNVYVFGPHAAPIAEDAAYDATTRKGRLRIAMERRLRDEAASGLRCVVVRAGDYFGPTVRNGLVDRIFGRARQGRALQAFGDLEVAHQWAYVPDLARLTADLLDSPDKLAPFQIVHFAGHVARTQREFLAAVSAAAGQPRLRVRVTPWWLLRATGAFAPVVRELIELRYLFDGAVILDDPVRRALLPGFVATPLAQAIAETLASYPQPR